MKLVQYVIKLLEAKTSPLATTPSPLPPPPTPFPPAKLKGVIPPDTSGDPRTMLSSRQSRPMSSGPWAKAALTLSARSPGVDWGGEEEGEEGSR